MCEYMKNHHLSFLCLVFFLLSVSTKVLAETVATVSSPTTGLKADVELTGRIPYLVASDSQGRQMAKVKLGLSTSAGSFVSGLTFVSATEPQTIQESYTAIHGKRSAVSNSANSVEVTFANAQGKEIVVEVRAYEDGVVFRYKLPGDDSRTLTFGSENTCYIINSTFHRWLQPFNTSYEADFPYQARGGQQGTWGYPALFENNGSFALITEANIGRSYSSTHLDNKTNATQYQITYPSESEGYGVGSVNPTWTGDWTGPWRVIIIGSLATIVESTLVEDVSEPCAIENTDFIQPGSAAWVYWAYNHGTQDYQICTRYVDLAVAMGWPYVLFDWEWERMGNGGGVEDAVRYATTRGVKPMLWYHSNDEKMQNRSRRRQEFAWHKRIGVKGVKIDFFESDKQHTMQYFADILEDAAKYEILVNFHGCTIPRGWSRTYPHLMSQEAVFGGEQYNNGGTMTTEGARINCLFPYTRNVVGPMDYTPVAFTDSQHPHTTTFAHELALSVAFESGIQHWADRPEGFYALPLMAKRHMMKVPVAWDETRFIDGYPGQSFIVARRKGGTWYVGVLNGKSQKTAFDIPLAFLGDATYSAALITDGSKAREFSFASQDVTKADNLHIECLSRGGAVITLSQKDAISSEELKTLQEQANDLLQSTGGRIGHNSGSYSQEAVEALTTAFERSKKPDEYPVGITDAYYHLLAAYSNFEIHGQAEGGLITPTSDMEDITIEYLLEARNFSRGDASTAPNTRFGLLAEPWVVTDNIINQDNGSHGGFDSYEGGRAISLEKWNGGEPALVNDKIYQTTKAALPAGDYHIHISVTCRAGLDNSKGLLRVARGDELPNKGVTKNVLATYDMSRTDYSGEYDVCNFHLDEAETLTLGWVFNIPKNESGHAMRVTAIRIIDADGNDVSASYLDNYQSIQRRDRSYVRFGEPTNWEVADFSISNGGDGTKRGIDRYPGYDCLMLGVWDDASRATGNLANARIYRQVTLPAGRYYFCAAYNAIYNLSKAYTFAATEPLTAAQTPDKAIAFYALGGTPEGDDLYGIVFTLENETTLYLGWNADLTTASQQEFRAKTLRLFRDKNYDPNAIISPKDERSEANHGEWMMNDESVAVYDLNGRPVTSQTLGKGLYIVRSNSNGAVRARKVLVK